MKRTPLKRRISQIIIKSLLTSGNLYVKADRASECIALLIANNYRKRVRNSERIENET